MIAKIAIKKIIRKVLIFERWFMFLFKTIRSLYRNDYYLRRDKYISKYNMKYFDLFLKLMLKNYF